MVARLPAYPGQGPIELGDWPGGGESPPDTLQTWKLEMWQDLERRMMEEDGRGRRRVEKGGEGWSR